MSSSAETKLMELVQADRRYPLEAYEFLCMALSYTQKRLERALPEEDTDLEAEGDHHISGGELLDGIREFGLEQFGMLAGCVFNSWGIVATDDFGRMVFKLVEIGLWHKSPNDRLEDFFGVYDFQTAFVDDFVFETTDFD